MNLLAAWYQSLIPPVFVTVCVLLILVILLQKGRGGGLAGAFGGGGGGYSAFGTKTGDVFTWVTVALTFVFVAMSCVAVWFWVPKDAAPIQPGVQGTEMPIDAGQDSDATTTKPAG